MYPWDHHILTDSSSSTSSEDSVEEIFPVPIPPLAFFNANFSFNRVNTPTGEANCKQTVLHSSTLDEEVSSEEKPVSEEDPESETEYIPIFPG